jgi:hypothetical protein
MSVLWIACAVSLFVIVASDQYSGVCTYTPVPICSGLTISAVVGQTGSISSDFSGPFNSSINCAMLIVAPVGYIVKLQFTNITIPLSSNDYLNTYDLADASPTSTFATLLTHTQADNLGQTFKISSFNRKLSLVWTCGDSRPNGFCLTWTTAPQPTYTIHSDPINVPITAPLVATNANMTDAQGSLPYTQTLVNQRTLLQCPPTLVYQITFYVFCTVVYNPSDYLAFYDGPFPTTWTLAQYSQDSLLAPHLIQNFSGCGGYNGLPVGHLPASFQSKSNQLVVNFVTYTHNPAVPPTDAAGFEFNFQCVSTSTSSDVPQSQICSSPIIFAPAGTSATLGYGNGVTPYPAGLDCTTTITAPPGFVISVSWVFFDLTSWKGDSVSVWDNNAAANVLTRVTTSGWPFQGRALPLNVVSQNPSLVIRFLTNTDLGTGWVILYTVVPQPTYTIRQDITAMPIVAGSGCMTNYFTVTTPQLNTDYLENANNRALFMAPLGQVWSVSFNTFCTLNVNAFLNVYIGPFPSTAPTFLRNGASIAPYLTYTYSGCTLPPSFVTTSNQMLLTFTSNGDGVDTGFKFCFTAAAAVPDVVPDVQKAANLVRLADVPKSLIQATPSKSTVLIALCSLAAVPILLIVAAIFALKVVKSQQPSLLDNNDSVMEMRCESHRMESLP